MLQQVNPFYAYVHARPATKDASGIFYVGKGRGRRAYKMWRNNPHHQHVVAKHGAENILVGKIDCSSEETAFELERGLIKCLRRMGISTTNQTDGGEGPAGLVFSDESKALISKSLVGNKRLLGHVHTQESREKMSVSIKAAHTNDPAISERMSEALRGNKFRLGIKHTEETLAKIAASSTGRKHKEESKKKIGDAQRGELNHAYGKPSHNRGVQPKDETRNKLSAAITGRKMVIRDGVRKMPKVEDLEAYLNDGWGLVK